MIDTKRGNLSSKLEKKGIILPSERQKISAQTSAIDKVASLLMMMGQKTAAEFESFLTVLSDSGQQAIADAVQQALHVVGQRGQNPLQYISRKAQYFYFHIYWMRQKYPLRFFSETRISKGNVNLCCNLYILLFCTF